MQIKSHHIDNDLNNSHNSCRIISRRHFLDLVSNISSTFPYLEEERTSILTEISRSERHSGGPKPLQSLLSSFSLFFFSHSSFSFFISLVFLSFAPLSFPHVKQGRERPRENHRRRDDTRHTLVHRRQSHRARHPPAPPGIPLLLTHSLTHSLPLAPSLARIATTATYPAFTR